MAKKISAQILSVFLFVPFISCKQPQKEQSATRPNIIFIMSDDHAFQAISAYNRELINTPNIDKIAHEGILYTKAFVTNSLCAPSRAVILTGTFSHINGVKGNDEVFDGTQQTLPQILSKNGYKTAIVGKWHLKSSPTGFDYWNILPGQGDYYNPEFSENGKDTVFKGYVTELITDISLNWLESREKDKPFFLMMHHKAPHRNWMPALKNLNLFDEKVFPFPGNFYDNYEGRIALQRQMLTIKNHMDIRMDFKVPCNSCDTARVNSWAPAEYLRNLERLSPAERHVWAEAYQKEEREFRNVKDDEEKFDHWKFRRFLEDYLRCIASVDESVGEVLDFLKVNGLDKNTIVIYTSDQGFYLGEHGLFDKRFMYEEALRTPLVMKYPVEISGGTNCGLLVQNIDIAPTILELAGIPIPKNMQGESLRKTWKENHTEWRDAIYYHYYEKGFGATPHCGIRTNTYKLIHYYNAVDSWELYDLTADISEMNNLVEKPAYAEVVKDLKTKLTALQEKYQDSSTD